MTPSWYVGKNEKANEALEGALRRGSQIMRWVRWGCLIVAAGVLVAAMTGCAVQNSIEANRARSTYQASLDAWKACMRATPDNCASQKAILDADERAYQNAVAATQPLGSRSSTSVTVNNR